MSDKYNSNIGQTTLRWSSEDSKGILGSGWNPTRKTSVGIQEDPNDSNKLGLIMEPAAPGLSPMLVLFPIIFMIFPEPAAEALKKVKARAFFFERNPETRKVDLLLRLKPFSGKERKNIYRDCTYLELKKIDRSRPTFSFMEKERKKCMLRLTCESGLFDISAGVALLPRDIELFEQMVQRVNELIASCLRERDDLNCQPTPFLTTSDQLQVWSSSDDDTLENNTNNRHHSTNTDHCNDAPYPTTTASVGPSIWIMNCNCTPAEAYSCNNEPSFSPSLSPFHPVVGGEAADTSESPRVNKSSIDNERHFVDTPSSTTTKTTATATLQSINGIEGKGPIEEESESSRQDRCQITRTYSIRKFWRTDCSPASDGEDDDEESGKYSKEVTSRAPGTGTGGATLLPTQVQLQLQHQDQSLLSGIEVRAQKVFSVYDTCSEEWDKIPLLTFSI